MKTGEGKTLVATMPAYLNALTGKGVHIVTVNDYLAKRDSDEMGKVYSFLGLTTGLIVQDRSPEEKKAAYDCDITYGTNNEIGFDYLRDNMARDKRELTQRGFNFAVVDEVDSILIDEARTPLIISGPGAKPDELYRKADSFVRGLRALRVKEMDTKSDNENVAEDYIVDEKGEKATLTAHGVEKAERFFNLENLSDPENNEIVHHIDEALQAYGVKKRDVDYVVTDGKVMIVDSFTGRIMPGRRFSQGLHQAIEAKERVKIQSENQTVATITFQNLFRLYKKLSGMTGTALTEEDEFRAIYDLDVVTVPTNKPMIRNDHHDSVYKNEAGKYRAVIKQIRECHEKGQPVLVGTVSVDKSEALSAMLKKEGITHNVLNAKYHAREAEIIAQAGKFGAVTISTNMAGRGTDIMLGGNAEFMAKNELKKLGLNEEDIVTVTGTAPLTDTELIQAREKYAEDIKRFKEEIAPDAEKVRNAGGLFILGTERHESRRIDNQLRGRSGRQGDPGESRFYLSLDDDLMRLFGSGKVQGIVETLGLGEDEPINAKMLSDSIERAQKHIEGINFNRRKNTLDYDDVMNQQRTIIYNQRREVLDGADMHPTVMKMIHDYISSTVLAHFDGDKADTEGLKNNMGFFILPAEFEKLAQGKMKERELEELIQKRAVDRIEKQKEVFGDVFPDVERSMLLYAVDYNWMTHLDSMDGLRDGVGLSAYASRNPLTEYRIAGGEMFEEMVEQIKADTALRVLFSRPKSAAAQATQANNTRNAVMNAGNEKSRPVVKGKNATPGPNDPCPCGSGKKYKKCCGLKDS